MKLIDKLKPISAISNVATVGYQTLFAVFTNGAAGSNYVGTKAEADAIKNALVIKLAETTGDDGYDADKQYLSVRTIAGTKQFIAELSLSGVLVKSMTLAQATLVSAFLTLPSQSEV